MDENYWRVKDDEEVIAAASHLADYTEAAQGRILAEMQRRGLRETQIQEKEIPEGRKSRIPRWVRHGMILGLSAVLAFKFPVVIAVLISLALVEPLSELANYGPLRERLRLALGVELGILNLALAILVYPRYLAPFMPGYYVIGVSAFLCLGSLYFIELLDGGKRPGVVKWVSISAGISVLLGLGGWLIALASEHWHLVSQQWHW